MKKNQKGFSFVEIMLVLIFATLIGFVGWYVWKSHSEQAPKTSQASKSVSESSNSKTFSHSELAFTFKYPSSWETLDNDTEYGFYSVRLRAPGTVVESNMGEIIKSGAQITLLRNRVSQVGSIEEFANRDAKYLTNEKNLSIDGIKALEYDNYDSETKIGLHGVRFYKDGIDYSITLDKNKYDKSEYSSVFDSIVKSIKFN